ncbi:MAG: DUF3048 domain-containing protein [Acidimicrobiales bacterium]
MHQFPRPTRSRLLALLTAATVLAGACGGGNDDDSTGAKAGQATTTTAAPMPAPLTGVVLTDGSVASRPAISVKVDNTPKGRPQTGLDKADVLIEEKVEGGFTRFIAVFHSEDADLVGPVRSVRSTDPDLVGTFGGVFAFAGGIPAFEKLANAQPVTVVSEGVSGEGFQYPAGKRRPYATYTATPKLRSLAKDRTQPPPKLFEFLPAGGTFAPAGATPAVSANVGYGSTTFTVDYDAATSTWKRSSDGKPHVLEGGAQLAFANVIIQRTSYRATGFRDPAGSAVDEATVIGEGDAIVLSQGKQAAIRWKKASATTPTTYTDSAGAPVQLLPGKTLIALPPAGNAITVK